MCEWGDTVPLMVPIPASCSHTGEFRWALKPIDRCIAPLVSALNKAGLYTRGACCGHGKLPPSVILDDDTFVVLMDRKTALEFFDRYGIDIHGNKTNKVDPDTMPCIKGDAGDE